MLSVGTKVKVLKGYKKFGISKGVRLQVIRVELLGPDYSHPVKVILRELSRPKNGKTFEFEVQHLSRLSDPTVRLYDGGSQVAIEVKEVK